MMTEGNPSLSQAPVFIMGIMPRSGTNFLYDLLLLHPHCDPGLAAEDFLIAHSNLLVKYAETVIKEWKPHWRVKNYTDQTDGLVCRYLGDGLLSFLNLKFPIEAIPDEENSILGHLSQQRLVTKTPSVKNLKNFFKIFPDARLLLIVRDGRAVVESGLTSFQWNFEVMVHTWADAAKTILEFDQQMRETDCKYLLVRYEDLYQQTETQLKKILTFLGLGLDCYDFEKAANLSVRGSSELHKKGKAYHHWKPIEKKPDFNPLARWSHWGQARRQRFNWIAGEYLAQFGYCQAAELKSTVWWQIWNLILDIKWNIRTVLARLKRLWVEKWASQK